jgi:RES domain-containing protein
MLLYRLTQKKYADRPFDATGAKLFGGRWNSRGIEALYFAGSEALCALEVFVHLNNDPAIADLYQLYRIDLPEHFIATLVESDLPADWRAIPATEATQLIGDEFLTLTPSEHAALELPSAIAPRDKIYLLNPHHPIMPDIFAKAEVLAFSFDARIFK